MPLISWLTLVCICALGAMSPGPSLVTILQNRVQRGLSDALVASWSHAAGIFFWALAASTTLGTLFHRIPGVKILLTLAGAVFLIYLAIKSWGNHGSDDRIQNTQLPAAWFCGLSISFLNPKIFVFFTALFSQFIPEGASLITLSGMATVAGIIDGAWYSLVSLLVGYTGLEKGLKRHSILLNRVSAVFYLVIAGLSVGKATGVLVWLVH
ncbi:MAG: LysE family translocator [Desulfobulbaceae bacterium]|nr:LysE family translocator [Desulfobulbaceae bacterium]